MTTVRARGQDTVTGAVSVCQLVAVSYASRRAQEGRLVERASGQLQADRQRRACLRPPATSARHADAGKPARFALTVKMSARYICSGSSVFSPSANGGWGCRHRHHVDLLEGALVVLSHQRPDLQRLQVVRVVVAWLST
jgi:hypothetical protein